MVQEKVIKLPSKRDETTRDAVHSIRTKQGEGEPETFWGHNNQLSSLSKRERDTHTRIENCLYRKLTITTIAFSTTLRLKEQKGQPAAAAAAFKKMLKLFLILPSELEGLLYRLPAATFLYNYSSVCNQTSGSKRPLSAFFLPFGVPSCMQIVPQRQMPPSSSSPHAKTWEK